MWAPSNAGPDAQDVEIRPGRAGSRRAISVLVPMSTAAAAEHHRPRVGADEPADARRRVQPGAGGQGDAEIAGRHLDGTGRRGDER
jgi:hypothetical protein